jgi:hypothetical protein
MKTITKVPKRLLAELSKKQRKLARKHGTPPEFSAAVWACVPGEISSEEAQAAINKYFREWSEAA